MKKYQRSLFLFRRDLRIDDNSGLINACKNSSTVHVGFIINPKFLNKTYPKFSAFRINFLNECLLELKNALKKKKAHLSIFSGENKKIIENYIKNEKINAIFVNKDYTSFSKLRDEKIKKICKKHKIDFISSEDVLLHIPEMIKSGKGKPYNIFSYFFAKACELPIRKPQKFNFLNISNKKIDLEITLEECILKKQIKTKFKGGISNCRQILKNLEKFKNYDKERNFPSIDGTTLLSAHNKFGTCSIREVYHKIEENLGADHPLIRQIHWRDFFTYIMYHYPDSFSKEFNSKYQKLPWSKNKRFFSKWCEGITGFPIIDSGMRELNSTGFMHNRIRMIVASFLTKDLHIDWRLGERYFASKLIDYDPSVNIGNWQWAASTGCDAQPWFRIFNPWLQQKKFDPDCVYIKKWIPELKNKSPKTIHNLWKFFPDDISYCKPIVEHNIESQIAKQMFKQQNN